MSKHLLVGVVGALLAVGALAQPSITVSGPDCLPMEGNTPITAQVKWSADPGHQSGASLRLYFRRLHPFGEFYYLEMVRDPSRPDTYYSVFPIPEERAQSQLNDSELADEWWDVLRTRPWVSANRWGRDELAGWLAQQEYEAAEYFVAPHSLCSEDPIDYERRDIRLVPVKQDCPVALDTHQSGLAESLTVGELTAYQAGKQVYHWECWGIVSRISANDAAPACTIHPDSFCRACVVATFPIAPLAGGLVAVTTEEISPSRP